MKTTAFFNVTRGRLDKLRFAGECFFIVAILNIASRALCYPHG